MPAPANPLRDFATSAEERHARRVAYGNMTRVVDESVMEARGLTRCAKCFWKYEGPLDIGAAMHRNHRAVAHPSLALRSSPPSRTRGGKSPKRRTEEMSDAVRTALAHLEEHGASTVGELADLTGKPRQTLAVALGWARKQGKTTAAAFGHLHIWALTEEEGHRWYTDREAERNAVVEAKRSALVEQIVALAQAEPGLATQEYTQFRIPEGNATARKEAIWTAEEEGRIHRVKASGQMRVFPGPAPNVT